MVKYSIIVPVYNISKKYLDDCIKSLVAQTYGDYEILIIDDGSTNGCGIWCDEWSERYNNIKSIHQVNSGVSAARNTGINSSQGSYLIFVDPDDWIDSNLLETIESVLRNNDFDVLVYSYLYEYTDRSIAENNELQGSVQVLSESVKKEMVINLIDTEKKVVYRSYKGKIFGAVWAKCYNKEFIITNNIAFNVNLKKAQDTVFNLWAIQLAKRVIVCNEPLYHYRMVKGSITHRYNPNIIDIQTLFLNAIQDFIGYNGATNQITEAFVHRCILSYFSILELDIFNVNNEESYWRRRARWYDLIKSSFIKNITIKAIMSYSVKSKAVLLFTKLKIFSALNILFKIKRSFFTTPDINKLYD